MEKERSCSTVPRDGPWMSRPMNRRAFLETQIKGALYLTAGAMGACLPESVFGSPVPDIAVATGETSASTRAAVDLLGGMKAFVKKGDKVVIKPNMSFQHKPEAATTTNPLVTRELVAMCKEAGASRIRVLDHTIEEPGPSVHATAEAVGTIQEGIVHALRERDFFRAAPIPQGVHLRETEVLEDVLNADVLIAAPIAKSHWASGVSLSMKGMMGLIWDRMAFHRDYDLDEAIVDLCSLLKADLTVTDATRVLSTGGPRGPGKIVMAHTIIASSDMVAADAKTVQMFEWFGKRMEPRQVSHILLAHERKIGRMDLENLKIKEIRV